MDRRERAAVIRLLIVCAAWALGEALIWQLRVGAVGLVVPALLAAAAYLGTQDMTWAGSGGSQYWRGRQVDRDRWRH